MTTEQGNVDTELQEGGTQLSV